ncbi:MAG TPA: hypothetical protein VGH09_00165 [Solirubrobacteraceae bacterium]|jgi:hypothetical protein
MAVAVATSTTMAIGAVPTFAHDCFNPTKNENAPTAGVHYTITSFTQEGQPVFEKTAQGKGIGGFVALSPEATGAPETLYVHSIGHSESHETVGGPGSMKPEHACNGKGIDYLEACGTGS